MSSKNPARSLLFFVISLCAVPFLILFASQVVWLQSPSQALFWIVAHPKASMLFWFLFAALSLTILGFCRKLFWAALPATAIVMFFSVVSRYKMNINNAPLQLSDFSFVKGLGDIAHYAAAQLIPSGMTVLGVVIAVAVLVALAIGQKWKPPVLPSVVAGFVCLILLVGAVFPGPFQSAAARLGADCESMVQRNAKMGVPLGLYSAWSQRLLDGTQDTAQDVTQLARDFRETMSQPGGTVTMETAPDIIFVTSESFFDITRLPGLTFDRDPLPVFHDLADRGTSGRFLSNNYGGGTGGVEMEMFTALSPKGLKEGDTLCTLPAETYSRLPSTVRLLKNAGYQTTAIHSHNNILYNRTANYPGLGFDRVLFYDDFLVEPVTRGTYISDESFAQEIIARYETRDPAAPCLIYGMSMENHQGYTPDKYPSPSGITAYSEGMTRQDYAILDALVQGLHNADASLGTLVDYFSQVDRPVMLVFVGDHLPSLNLADGVSLYDHQDGINQDGEMNEYTLAQRYERFTTDYVVWTNYEDQPLPDRNDSCMLLGVHTLERAGIPLDPYFSWLLDGMKNAEPGPDSPLVTPDLYPELAHELFYGQ